MYGLLEKYPITAGEQYGGRLRFPVLPPSTLLKIVDDGCKYHFRAGEKSLKAGACSCKCKIGRTI